MILSKLLNFSIKTLSSKEEEELRSQRPGQDTLVN